MAKREGICDLRWHPILVKGQALKHRGQEYELRSQSGCS